jgi:signal transduction histidine kinase
MYHNLQIPSLFRRVGISILLGVIIALIGSVTEATLDKHSIIGMESLDDIVIGILAAIVVFAYEQRRHRAMLNKVRVIAAMNHHVRNALQAISYAPYTEQEKQIKMIGQSVQRIQWALREILPAEESAPDTLFSHSTPAPPRTESGSAPGNEKKMRA